MLINLSNHPSQYWGNKQLEAAREYGEIVDLPFPAIAPDASEMELQSLATESVQKILSLGSNSQIVVHIMGEMTFTFLVVSQLKEKGIKCVASTTERNATENGDGTKLSEFSFVKFREY